MRWAVSSESLADKLKYWRENKRAPGRLRKAGTSRTKEVIAEVGDFRGEVAGTQTEHWDGKVDGNVHARTVVRTSSGD